MLFLAAGAAACARASRPDRTPARVVYSRGNPRANVQVTPPRTIRQEDPMTLKTRRELMQLLGVGGAVFASGLAGAACNRAMRGESGAEDDFFFVQLSDTHWGFKGPPNPDAENTL